MTRTLLRSPAVLVAALLALALSFGIALAAPSTAPACPPQGCHVPPDDDPPPHPTPGPPAPKYRLTILTVHPVKTEDSTFDEAYIKVKGIKVAGPKSISSLSTWYPNVVRDVTGPIYIEVYDDDSPDSDDWLGTVYPRLPALGSPYYETFHFMADGAHYEMLAHVARLS